ncbi:MAG: J domain-containing protein [Janthinobacterium lividum]
MTTDSTLPQRQSLPERVASPLLTSPAQLAFREAMQAVDDLRAQLLRLRTSQAATRQAYWQQVGPVAAATVAARRALHEPLETALLDGYLNRAEEVQVTELLVHNARSLQERFGEDESVILMRYAPPLPPPDDEPEQPSIADATPPLASHEQAAAAARAHRQQQRQQARAGQAQAAAADDQALLSNTKVAYRQLARLHHPDRAAQADAATQRTQTELMQRITAAYAAGDLAALLSLLADSDGSSPPSAEAEALLLRYTEALAQQQQQLAQQLAAARRPDEQAPWSGTEKQQRTHLREIKRSLRAETDYLTYLLGQLREPTDLKVLLRELNNRGQTEL